MKVHTKLIKAFGALLIAALLFAALPAGTAKAQTADTTWYSSGSSPFTLTTADELAGLAQLVNDGTDSFSGKTILLGANISLSAYTDWTPIGTSTNPFKGTFDGQNYKISDLSINTPTQKFVGLFGKINPGTVSNLTLENVTLNGLESVGALAGSFVTGTVTNVHASDVVINSTHWAGGLVGYSYASYTDCSVEDVIVTLIWDTTADDNGDKAGGMVGYQAEGSFTFTNCTATNVNITGVRDVGGLVGAVQYGNTFTNCHVYGGTVTAENTTGSDASPWAGGLFGRAAGSPISIINSSVTGVTVSSYDPAFAGPVVGGPLSNVTFYVHNVTQDTWHATLQEAVTAAIAGDVVEVQGTTILSSVVNLNKDITLTCADDAKIQVSGTGDRFDISAAASIIGCEIEKTDKTGEQNIIRLRASDITIQDNIIHGQYEIGDSEVSRAMVFNAGGYSGYLIDGNEIYNLRQPAYISGTHTGTISDNFVHGTKGWVLEGGNLTFSNNTWGSGADANVIDIAILSLVGSSYYTDVPAMSAANNNAVIEDQRTSPATLNPVYVDASAPACTADCGTAERPYQTIQAGIDRVVPGGTVYVAAGTYSEFFDVYKSLSLIGPNAGIPGHAGTRSAEATIVGVSDDWLIGYVESEDVLIDGFTFNGGPLDPGLYYTAGLYVASGKSTIQNSVFTDFSGMAILTSGGSYGTGYISDVLIKDNYITNPVPSADPSNFGIYLQSTLATVKGNVVDNMRSGIQVQPYNNPGYGLVEDNSFSAYGRPLWFNYAVHADSDWLFKNNTVTGIATPAGVDERPFDGIRVETFYEGNVSFTGNTINIGTADASEIYMFRKVNERGGVIDLEATIANNTWEKLVVIRDSGGIIREVVDVQPTYTQKDATFYSSIQDAIDAASNGDTIEVGPGTYAEYVELRTPNITVRSTAGAAETELVTPSGTLTTGVKVLANMGTVTFDGFTVKNFTESGIIQPMSARTGTTFHVLNNVVIPFADYLRNGIQVSGDGSTVIGNTVYGKRLTDDWGSTGITVVDGSNISVLNNTIIGGATGVDYGIGIIAFNNDMSNITIEGNTITDAGVGVGPQGNYWGTYYSISDLSILSNIITDSDEGIGAYWFDDLTNLVVERNQFNNLLYGGLWIDTSVTGTVSGIDASPNWWGSIDGPDQLSADVDVYIQGATVDPAVYTPWCGDAVCSFLLPEEELTGTITDTITIDTPGMIYFLKDGTVIDPGTGPCFDIQASNVTIYTESPGGAVCYPGSPGIQVIAGAQNIVISGLEIDGQDTAVGHGIHFLGSIEDLYLSDNFIHNMVGDGVHFAAVPTGRVEIKGNLFMGNTGVGVEAPGDVNVTYNAWGDYDGPEAGDGVSTNITSYTPWTHVDVFAEYQAASSSYAEEVAVGEQITYVVKADLQNAIGAHFTLTFDTAKLAVVSASTDGTVFPFPFDESGYPEGTVVLTEGVTVLDNKITFDGASTSAISGEGQLLFTVTFEGLEATDTTTALSFEAEDDAQFAMNPGVGPSLNIFPVALVGEDVNVYDLPTLAIAETEEPKADFAAGNPKEFTLTVTNPSTGRDYTTLNVELDVPLGTTLEYFDGTNWVTYLDGVEIGPLATDATKDVLFRVTFSVNGGSVPVTVDLYDDAIFLVTDTFGFSVAPAFTVTASVSMQGRSVFNGVLVTLSEGAKFGDYTATSVNLIKNNVTFENVGEDGYILTITQDRYLDLILANGKSVLATADVVLAHIELRGGDLNNSNDVGLSDASIVGRDYGLTGDNQGDGNFDSRVNIYDLAMVGGNYGLTSEAAYGTP